MLKWKDRIRTRRPPWPEAAFLPTVPLPKCFTNCTYIVEETFVPKYVSLDVPQSVCESIHLKNAQSASECLKIFYGFSATNLSLSLSLSRMFSLSLPFDAPLVIFLSVFSYIFLLELKEHFFRVSFSRCCTRHERTKKRETSRQKSLAHQSMLD